MTPYQHEHFFLLAYTMNVDLKSNKSSLLYSRGSMLYLQSHANKDIVLDKMTKSHANKI